MNGFDKVILGAALLFFSGSVVAWFFAGAPVEAPPQSRVSDHALPPLQPVQGVPWTTMRGPWIEPAPRVEPPRPPAPVPLPTPAPRTVDRTSVKYLGSLRSQGGQRSYLFKYLPTGLILNLEPGAATRGWTLSSAGESGYVLEGPGGFYEALR